MSKFGWSMPAGAWESRLPGEEDDLPAVCVHCEREECDEECAVARQAREAEIADELAADEAAYQEYVEMASAEMPA